MGMLEVPKVGMKSELFNQWRAWIGISPSSSDSYSMLLKASKGLFHKKGLWREWEEPILRVGLLAD